MSFINRHSTTMLPYLPLIFIACPLFLLFLHSWESSYYAFKLLFPGNSNCNSSICSVQADCVGNCIETACVLSNISRAVWNVAFKINCHFKKKKKGECLTVMRRKKRCVECVGRTLEWHYSLISCINISMASTGSKAADRKWTIVILLCINPLSHSISH